MKCSLVALLLIGCGMLPSAAPSTSIVGEDRDWTTLSAKKSVETFARSFQCPFLMDQWNPKTLFLNGTRHLPRKNIKKFEGGPCSKIVYNQHTLFNDEDIIKRVFRKYHQSNMYFVGDSMSAQHFISLACKLSPYLVNHTVTRGKKWCNSHNVCLPDSPYGPITYATAVFQYNNEYTLHLFYNIGVRWSALQEKLKGVSVLKAGDVLLLNHGLHHLQTIEAHLQLFLENTLPVLVALQARGIVVVWRETTAAHFQLPPHIASKNREGKQKTHIAQRWTTTTTLTNDSTVPSLAVNGGYWQQEKRFVVQQARKSMKCAHHTLLNESQAWTLSTNPQLNLYFIRYGISILRVWKATFTAPPQCHIGHGVDCVHFYIPSAVAEYFAKVTLLHLLGAGLNSYNQTAV